MQMLDITMAVKINKKTYPIAVACLAPGFLGVPMKESFGCYLVINEVRHVAFPRQWTGPSVTRVLEQEDKRTITLENSWMEKSMFEREWDFVEKEIKGEFCRVQRR